LAVSVLNWQGLALIVQLWALVGRDKARKTGGVAKLLKKQQVNTSYLVPIIISAFAAAI
jgi:hypothetical protein